jgi:hypothetical protein
MVMWSRALSLASQVPLRRALRYWAWTSKRLPDLPADVPMVILLTAFGSAMQSARLLVSLQG